MSIYTWIGRQDWLDPVEKPTQRAVSKVAHAPGHGVKDFLHGTWLGHPVHAAVTDVPLGAWTAAVACDVLDIFDHRGPYEDGARCVIGLGLIGAVTSAVTGLTDWSDTDPPARRVGLIHGLLNVAGVGLFTASYILRGRRARNTGKLFALAGLGTAAVSAWLGGALVYNDQIGVDHTSGETLPQDWVAAMPENELPDNQPRKVEVNGIPVLLVRRGRRIDAIFEKCAHLGGPLSEGTLEGDTIRCPWHASVYSLEDGHVIHGPSTHNQPAFETRVRNGQVEIRKATGAPRVMTAG